MRVVPAIPQSEPLPSLAGLVRMGFEMWRLRRIAAGLNRATSRGDTAAASWWLARVDLALADFDRAQSRMRPRRRPR